MKTYHEHMVEAQRRYLAQVLRRAGGCVSKAAKLAGLNRTHLHRLLSFQPGVPRKVNVHRHRWAHRGNWSGVANRA